jgi:hypothetical protein
MNPPLPGVLSWRGVFVSLRHRLQNIAPSELPPQISRILGSRSTSYPQGYPVAQRREGRRSPVSFTGIGQLCGRRHFSVDIVPTGAKHPERVSNPRRGACLSGGCSANVTSDCPRCGAVLPFHEVLSDCLFISLLNIIRCARVRGDVSRPRYFTRAESDISSCYLG